MLILKTLAFILPVIGLSSIAGAIETGTSPAAALVMLLIGCLVMKTYIRLNGWDAIIGEIEGKEDVMSGLEREELTNRTQGMTTEEMCIVAGLLPDDVLWEELHQRYSSRSAQVENVRRDIGG